MGLSSSSLILLLDAMSSLFFFFFQRRVSGRERANPQSRAYLKLHYFSSVSINRVGVVFSTK